MISRHLFSLFLILSMTPMGLAAETPKVGKKAAAEYFEKDQELVRRTAAASDNVLMLHLGTYVNSQAYEWKDSGRVDGVGKANYGVTYLFTDWNSLDVNLRADFSEYNLSGSRAVKLSLLPLWTFPRANTHFPLYFGFGAGAGVFFQQIEGKSNLSLDYQLVVGARFMDLFDSGGLFIEFGMKNHLHILSQGQFNGTTFAGGAVFHF